MNLIRTLVSALTLGLMALGYFASLYFAMDGRAAEWAQRIDQPSVRMLALVLFLGCVALGFVPEPEEPDV